MKDRLSKIITTEGLTPSLLADEIGVQRSGISHILSGRNYPSFDFLQKLLERFPKLNAEWLILGKGAMYKQSELKTLDLFPDVTPLEKTPLSPTLPEKPQNFATVEDDKITLHDTHTKILPSTPLVEKNVEAAQKEVEKIVIFYKDKTFASYMPES